MSSPKTKKVECDRDSKLEDKEQQLDSTPAEEVSKLEKEERVQCLPSDKEDINKSEEAEQQPLTSVSLKDNEDPKVENEKQRPRSVDAETAKLNNEQQPRSPTAKGDTNKSANNEQQSSNSKSSPHSYYNERPANFNPSVSDDEENDERMRGDAIGNTLYSERFVLSKLLKLAKLEMPLSEDKDFEDELCKLWDMTIEKDVVLFLLEQSVLELFTECIDATEDRRLAEILLGIIGNMCQEVETRQKLCNSAEMVVTLLKLISCIDSPTLIQLMRWLSVVFSYEITEKQSRTWFKHIATVDNFMQDLCHILSNSLNEELLGHALEALNAMLDAYVLIDWRAKNIPTDEPVIHFADLFSKEALVKSTIVAIDNLMPKICNTAEFKSSRKMMKTFLNIHFTLTQCDSENTKTCYAPHLDAIITCLGSILEPFTMPIVLFPLSYYEEEVVDYVSDILLALGDPFDEFCFNQIVDIWNLITEEMELRDNQLSGANDFEDEEPEEPEEREIKERTCLTLIDFMARIVHQATDEELQQALRRTPPVIVIKLMEALCAADTEDTIKTCFNKLKTAYDRIDLVQQH